MKRAVALVPLIVAVVLGGFFIWGLDPERDPSQIPSVLISQPAPAFDLAPVPGLDRSGLSRADLVGNARPVLVNVFASWCVPCKAEHAVLSSFVERDRVRLFGINYKDKPEDAVRWLADMGNNYERIGSDLNGRAGIEWGISGVPETFIVDGDGTVLYRYVGPIVGDTAVTAFRDAMRQAGILPQEES